MLVVCAFFIDRTAVLHNLLDSEYRDRLELKSPNDRTLGVGVNLSTNLLLILTATNMMKVSQDLDKIRGFRPESVSFHSFDHGSLTASSE